jgi:hypothetical protein
MQKNLVGKSEQGFGLLEIIIAAGLLALIVAVMNQNIVISINSQRSVELRGDKEDVKRRLVEFHDCNQTLTAVPSSICTGVGVRIDLKDRKGNTLIPKDGKLIGKWTYVPECGTTNSAVNVRAVHFKDNVNLQTPNLNQDDKYVKDPMTKKTIRIDQVASFLFQQNGAELCSQRNKKLVPFQGYYVSGANMPININGVPKFIMIFNPNTTSAGKSAYCMKTYDMTGTDSLCGVPSDPVAQYKIKFGASDFSVGGPLSTATTFGNTYPNLVYFGFMEVED